MRMQVLLSGFVFALSLFTWGDCASVPSCASMQSWFPGTPPANVTGSLPYELSVTGRIPDGETVPVYTPDSSHFVYLNGSMTADHKMRSFIGFIVYAENSVKNYTNGRFVAEDLPTGVQEVNCNTLYIVQNSTSAGNWTSLKLIWKPPKDGYVAGNITFRASVLEKTNPLTFYEGFTALLRYDCPLLHCVMPCPNNRYLYNGYGCRTCQCADEPCATVKCGYYSTCHPLTGKCVCPAVDNYPDCHNVNGSVCGSDGILYSDKCRLMDASCKQSKQIKLVEAAMCDGAESMGSTFPGLSLMFAFLALLWFSV